jgi:outer membrane lipoprotein carrier protein
MSNPLVKIFASLLIALCAISVRAGGLESLELFVKTVKSGKADFTQTVTAPAKEGRSARTKTSSGTFEFSRPQRFRFDYKKPFAQSIVADGQTLWLLDVDLNQVTARKQAQALASSPAALIASASDLRAVQADFTLTDAPDDDGQQWVSAVPKGKDSPLQSVRVGFRDGALTTLEILDTFGQQSVMRFSAFERNATPASARFQFKPPPGADVIQQ